jgi:hypothetical protein
MWEGVLCHGENRKEGRDGKMENFGDGGNKR